MSKHTLFVCKSCHRSSRRRPKNPPFDGDLLIDQLNNLCAEKFSSDEIEIQPVECLWACKQGCVVAVSSHDKPTYLFVNLSLEKSAAALMEFMQMYIKSCQGAFTWEQLPKVLKSAIFTQIPPIKS